MNYHGHHVLVLGLGLTGLSLALWLKKKGADVVVADTRDSPPKLADLRRADPDIPVRLGAWDETLFFGIDMVAISPGLNINDRAFAPARSRHISIVGDIELFARELPPSQKVIAITGSNGKSTVTALSGALCRSAGLTTVVAGNIGKPVLEVLADAEASGTHPDVYVLELSSFQLETTSSLMPSVATVLNVSPNHLDWHGDFDEYVRAKSRIFLNGGRQVLNRDDPLSMAMAMQGGGDERGGAGETGDGREGHVDLVTFGAEPPSAATQWGLRRAANGAEWLARGDRDLIPASALTLTGRHNALNALAALALVDAIGVDGTAHLATVSSFRGLPHRMTHVADVADVAYIDDSKSTTVASTIAALEGMGRKSVLIAGGDGKGQDFTPLVPAVREHARAVVVVGRDGPLVEHALRASGVDIARADSLERAVAMANRLARPGDAVLLSPACASWDMFRDYGERGDRFVQAVGALPIESNSASGTASGSATGSATGSASESERQHA